MKSHRKGARRRANAWRARKADVRLPGKANSISHGARPVHLIITMIKWIRTSRLSIKNGVPPRQSPQQSPRPRRIAPSSRRTPRSTRSPARRSSATCAPNQLLRHTHAGTAEHARGCARSRARTGTGKECHMCGSSGERGALLGESNKSVQPFALDSLPLYNQLH